MKPFTESARTLTAATLTVCAASSALVYTVATASCRRLLRRHAMVTLVRAASLSGLVGAAIEVAGALWLPGHVWPLLVGHWFFAFAHGIHNPCGQAGAVSDFPHMAGRAVAWSGFVMMMAAFGLGRLIAAVVGDDPARYGPWPMVLPLALAAVVLVFVTFVLLPRPPAKR